MATLVAELGVMGIDAATLRTFELYLKRLTTAPTNAGILKVFYSTLRTLHQHCPPLDYSLWPSGSNVKYLTCESFPDSLLVREGND